MATGFGTGFDINALDAAIKKAEQGIDKLISKGASMESSITNNFKNIAKNGVGDFINRLDEAKRIMSSLGVSSSGKSGISGIVDDVNKLTQSLGRTSSGNGFETIDKAMQSLMERIKMLSGEIKTFKSFEGGNLLNTEDYRRIGEVSDQLNILMKQYEALHNTRARLKQQGDLFKDHLDNINGVSVGAIKQKSELDKLNQAYRTGTSELQKKAKAEDESNKRTVANTQQLAREYEKVAKAKREAEYKKNTTYQGAMSFSERANSINREVKAIQYLTQARNNLSRKDEDYQNKLNALNERIKVHSKNIKEATKNSKDLHDKHKQLINTGDQLKRALAGVFSVSAIKGYITKVVEVRGEFEMQQRAMQALIKDVDKANKLWDKTIALAVKSPFRVKELVTYTKQLAAYQVESDKLYDTTKKLADVSAGLGVDMNRLILAYGQVKAANYLRGTELRQFTEAGIPMLDELAKYFTEIENRFVSAADVFDRISKRGVSFEDVDEVFNRITGENGIFYQMQEKQSETLNGMINNLRDSIDLMLNDIGASRDSALKGLISTTKEIVENWRAVAVVIKQVGFTLAISALKNFATGWKAVTLATFDGTASLRGATKAGAALRVSLQKLFATMAAHPILLVVGAFISAGHAAWKYKKSLDEVNKKYDEASAAELRKADNLRAISDEINKNNEVITDSTASQELHNKAIEDNDKILERLKKDYPDIYSSIVKQKDGTIELTEAIEEQNRKLQANIVLQQQAKGKFFQESEGENYKDAIEAQSKLKSAIYDVRAEAIEMGVKLEESIHKGILTEEDAKPIREYIKSLREATNPSEISKAWLNMPQNISKQTWKQLGVSDIHDAVYKMFDVSGKFGVALVNLSKNLDDQMSTFKVEMNNISTAEGRGSWLSEQLNNLGILDKEIRVWAKDYISKKIELDIVFQEPKKDDPKLKAWQETYNKKFGDNIVTPDVNESFAGFKQIKNEAEKQIDVIERLQAEYKVTKELIDSVNKAGGKKATGKGKAYEGTDLDKEKKNLKQIMEQLDFFGASYEKKTTGSDKALQRLKEQIRLIRDAAKAYDDMRKLHDKAYADEQIVKEYGPAFKEAKLGDISGYAFGTRQDEQNNLEKLRASAEKTTGGVLELNKAIAQVGVNIADADQEILDKKLFDSISDIFSNYEISLEMDKLNIPKDAARKLFGFDAIDLDEIREQVMGKFGLGEMSTMTNEQIYNSTEFKNLSKERQDELRASLEKEENLQNEHLQENLKKYIEFSRKALSERAKIKVDEINQLREIEKTFMATPLHDIETARSLGVSEEEIARMEAENVEISERNKLLTEYQALAKSSVIENSQQEMKKIEWDEFRSSDMFINMFNDLDKASEHLIKKSIDRIEEFKKTWKDMPVAAAKEMTNKLNELQLALYDSGRVGRDKKAIEKELNDEIESRGLKGKANTTIGQKNLSESVQGENQAYTELIEKSNQRITLLQIINDLKSENKALDLEMLGYNEEYIAGLGLTADVITNSVEANNELIKTEKQKVTNNSVAISSNQKILNLIDKQKTKAAQLGEKWSKSLGIAKDLYSSFQALSEAANWDFSDEVRIFGEMGVSIADAVVNAIALSSQLAAVEAGAMAAGTALNTAMGVVGWIVMAVQALVAVLTALSKLGQEKRAKEIEKEEKKVEELSKKYEQLAKSIEKAATAAKLLQDSMDMQANIAAQIEATENAISVYEDADYDKLTDEEKADWEAKKQELDELKEKAEELKESVSSKASAGILDDVLSAADGFADAWLSAFEETEDGMSGLEDSFDDMLKSILKRQMSLQIIGPVMEKWKQSLSKYVNEDDTVLSAEEAGKWASEVKDSFGAVNANLKAYAYALESQGINLHSEIDNAQSGLSGSISGMSEEQADILAAYWNAVRLSTTSIEDKMTNVTGYLSKLISNDRKDNPILDTLKSILEEQQLMYKLVDSLVLSGHSRGGYGMKVFID